VACQSYSSSAKAAQAMMVGGCHQCRCGAAQRRRSGHGSDQERQPLRTVTPCQDFDAIAMAIVGDGQPVAGMSNRQ
jgi:hypothetical protein